MTNLANIRKQPEAETLAETIPGWGSDLDPSHRPAVPKEKAPPEGTGAHWAEPEKQIPRIKIHKSPEHRDLTATFGTACPPRGISGMLRDAAYQLSEARNAHWFTLMLADRIDVVEGRVDDLLHGRMYHPVAEAGLKGEWRRLNPRIGSPGGEVGRLRNEVLLVVGIAALAVAGARVMLDALKPGPS